MVILLMLYLLLFGDNVVAMHEIIVAHTTFARKMVLCL